MAIPKISNHSGKFKDFDFDDALFPQYLAAKFLFKGQHGGFFFLLKCIFKAISIYINFMYFSINT